MRDRDRKGEPPLRTWKEIAAFLAVHPRTAQCWEKERGLPVHRRPGRKPGVMAYPGELRRWLKEEHPAPLFNLRFLRYYAAFTTAALLLGLGISIGWYIGARRTGDPATFAIDYKTLIVRDSAGQEIWRHQFDQPLAKWVYSDSLGSRPGLVINTLLFRDLNGDGKIETLFSYHPHDGEVFSSSLFCFDHQGNKLWEFVPGRTVSDHRQAYTDIFRINDFLVEDLEGDGRPEILVTSHERDSHPSQFALLDSSGRLRGEYWHSGHLPVLRTGDLDGDGRAEILLGGVNNGYRQAALLILDSDEVSGASQQAEGDPFQLKGFSPGTERALVLLPRSCINQVMSQYNIVDSILWTGQEIRVVVAEKSGDRSRAVTFRMGPLLKRVSVRYSDSLKELHYELRATGALDHSFAADEIEALKEIRVIRSGSSRAARRL